MLQRLQKLISAAGIASRRAAEEMIVSGYVTVNGDVVKELGSKADPEKDHIKVRGKLINPLLVASEKRHYLVNKPRGYLSSVSDPKKRPLVLELLPASVRRGLHPVGRLDFNSEGLIVVTNDGELTRQLTKAGAVPKVYHVKVKGTPGLEQIDRLRRGMRIDGVKTAPPEIRLLKRTREGDNAWYEVTLRQGKNQQIRKMFAAIGHSVTKLRRIRIGEISDRALPSGHYRELKPEEIRKLLMPAKERKSAGRGKR